MYRAEHVAAVVQVEDYAIVRDFRRGDPLGAHALTFSTVAPTLGFTPPKRSSHPFRMYSIVVSGAHVASVTGKS